MSDLAQPGGTEVQRAADVQLHVQALLDAIGVKRNRKLFGELLHAVAHFAANEPETLNVKIAASAVKEMDEAFEMFQPYIHRRKVTIFGSARTKQDDPLYAQARDVAKYLAANDWMVVTGAGPGIMQAAMEGAGRDMSIGVSIQLPFEQSANPIIAGDSKYVSMKYFFTRKLMLIKESSGFICLPGGFGTLDEMFELLTLTQTGKGTPVPIVFLDIPGDPYWEQLAQWMSDELITRMLVNPADLSLFKLTDSCEEAVSEITGFYSNFDSMRYLGDTLIVRLRRSPDDSQLATLNADFSSLCATGAIERASISSVELREGDRLDLQRLSLHFAKHGYGELRRLINALNAF
jgi:uncharacterized protein (TIGR00730 family)